MTLYELLHKVSFDELIPTLEGVYDVKDIYSYREAFDELMLNEAAGQTDGVIELSRDEDDENWIHVTGCDDCWSEVLASRIQIEDGLSFSDAELASRILWEMTYWGFSEDDTPSFMERPDNKYRRKWSEVHSRQMVMYARGRKEKKECFRGAMSWDICKRIWEREERRNRAKRMRDARMDRAMARLDRMSNVEECIKDLLRICPELGRGELEYLFDTKIVHETRFRQHKGDVKYSPATLQTLIKDYSDVPEGEYDSIILVLYSNSRENVSEETVSAIRDIFITGRTLKRAVLRVSEYANMKSGDIILKVVHSKDDDTQSRRVTYGKGKRGGKSRTGKRMSRKWLTRSE